jgi:Zn-dependent M28 family amino/carboxypeptidase
MIAVAPLRAGSPFLPSDWPGSRKSRALPRTRFTASLRTERETANGYNVVGVVRGSDPALRQSYVAYGAHYDHIGIQPAVGGDSIANGADDDGSGSTALLALARAFQQGPRPRRSVLFVWHTGEEKGLFGSARFVDRPTVPIDSVVAQLNADMIGRNAPDSLYVVGPAAAPRGQSRRLGEVVDSVNGAGERPFTFNREWDSPTHPEQIYFRSDHYNYARKGVPIVFFTTGLHEDYHKVTDEVGKIDFDKMARVSRLMYDVGAALANSPARPVSAPPAAGPATTP